MGLRGSCLCDAVKFEVEGAIYPLGNCHCRMCQKWHGAAFGTYWQLDDPENLKFNSGEEHVERYRSSDRVNRIFCRKCGSSLLFEVPERNWLQVAAAALDDEPDLTPAFHIFVPDKAPWCQISDELQCFEEWPSEAALSARIPYTPAVTNTQRPKIE